MSIDIIKKLKPAKYKYKDKEYGATDRYTLSVMAQDVNIVYPIDDYTILNKDDNGYFMVDHVQLIAPMLKAIQELTEEVERLKNDRD
jgi:hypothetical protein